MELIHKYFPDLSQEQTSKYKLLLELYTSWNQKINVISRKDLPHLYERHILHSLAIAKYKSFRHGSVVTDVGTGGGFPGIPLAIYFPEISFILVDSIAKKIKVVDDISRGLELRNVHTVISRAENLKMKTDYIVSRAVSPFNEFLKNTTHLLKQNEESKYQGGIIYLKGGDFGDELINIPGKFIIKNISDYYDEDFFETKKIIYFTLVSDKNI